MSLSRIYAILILALGSMFILSCDDDDFPAPPTYEGTEQQQVFQEFWHLYDRYYPLFFRKNIEWQKVFDTIYPKITSKTTDVELYQQFNHIMLNILQDGHSFLEYNGNQLSAYAPDYSAEISEMVSQNTPALIKWNASSENNAYLSYGSLKADNTIGYIVTKRFEPLKDDDSEFNGFKAIVDRALIDLKDKQGIILDLRKNGGGQNTFSFYLAGRFAQSQAAKPIARLRVKASTGSTESSLAEWARSESDGVKDGRVEGGHIGGVSNPNDYVFGPSGAFQYTRKVAVLTSKLTASAAEFFTVAIKSQPHVKTIGTTTFGIYGGSDIVTLHSGGKKWKTRLSVQDIEMYYGGKYQSFEGKGITPDQTVVPTLSQVNEGKDLHIEAALDYLK